MPAPAFRWASALLLAFGLSLVSSTDTFAATRYRAPEAAPVSARWGNVTCTVDRNGNLRVSGYTCIGSTSCRGLARPTTAQCTASGGTSYDWSLASWGQCSATCGSGAQTRAVTCRSSAGATVADSLCSGAKPSTAQSCNTQACPTYAWSTGAWSSCSNTCGGGTQTRAVSCKTGGTAVADSFCSASKPAPSQSCNTQVCSTANPAPPVQLAIAKTASCDALRPSWQAPDASIVGYDVYRREGRTGAALSLGRKTSGFTDPGLKGQAEYTYDVVSVNAANLRSSAATASQTTPACGTGELFTIPSVASGALASTWDVAVDATSQIAAVVSDGKDLVVVDLATRRVRTLALSGNPYAVSVAGETILVATATGAATSPKTLTLYAIDARKSLASLGILSSVALPGNFSGKGRIERSGSVLYVAGSSAGLLLVDGSNPSALRYVTAAWTGNSTTEVGVGDGIAIVHALPGKVATLDIAQPYAPRVLNSFNATIGDIELDGRLALTPWAGIVLVDFTVPTQPKFLNNTTHGSGIASFEFWNDLVVETPTFQEFRVFRFNRGTSELTLLGTRVMAWEIWTWTVAGDRLYAVDGTGTLHVFADGFYL